MNDHVSHSDETPVVGTAVTGVALDTGSYKTPEPRYPGVPDAAFVVDIKPSARRTNGAVGTLVNRRGTRHVFSSRDDAEMWASGLSSRGGVAVWIRSANPRDGSDADAYLVGRRTRASVLAGAYDKRRRRLRDGGGGEQSHFETSREESPKNHDS